MARLVEGGLIDRSKPLSFTFDGRHYQGFAGDTLASALVAKGGYDQNTPRGWSCLTRSATA